MNKFLVSEEAYKEFKAFLEENEVENYSIRINLAGFGCSGPAFNITVGEVKEGDIVTDKQLLMTMEAVEVEAEA